MRSTTAWWNNSGMRRVLPAVAAGLVYFLFARVGLFFTAGPDSVAVIWPASGFQLAILVLAGRDRRPLILLAFLLSNILANLVADKSLPVSIAFGLANISEGMLAVYLLDRFASPAFRFKTLKDVRVFLLFVVGAGTAVAAIPGAAIAHAAFGADFTGAWRNWWLADACGMLLFTPFIVEWSAEGREKLRNPDAARILEGVCAFVLLLAVFYLFVRPAVGTDRIHNSYLMIPFLIWIVIRLDTPGTVTANLAIAIGINAFALDQPGESASIMSDVIEQSQLFACITSGTMLFLSSVFSERSRAEQALKELNRSLDRQVAERTRVAEGKARRLAEFNLTQRRLLSRLRDTSAELDSFSWSVSHDLRAPLRRLISFSTALVEDCGESLPPRGLNYLDRIREASVSMEALLDALMVVSRVSRAEIRVTAVDLAATAREVVAALHDRYPGREVVFVAPERLEANGDPRLLRLVLENLLDNAWKFTARRVDARVEFGFAEVRDGIEYFVRDNGAGFDMAFVGEMFRPFQRLHPEYDFPGTGIGLATVRRVIARHGGRIRAEGIPGEGATIHFSLERSS